MDTQNGTTDWHDQDTWWEGTLSIIFSEQAWERAPQQVEQALALAGLEPPLRLLDIPCGVGRHTLEFARLGCEVTAVDRTALYLEHARDRAAEMNLDAEFVQMDMRDFQRPGAFDLVVNLFTSFGYFDDPADDRKVLGNFYASLRPGGVLVMDLMGKEVLAHIFRPHDWHELDDGSLVLEERRISQDWTQLENRWILIKDGEQHEFPFSHRLYGASDLKTALEQAGFVTIRIYGDLAGIPYDHLAQRLVVVAHKPAG